MTIPGGLTFGDPNVDLAAATAARAYGDDLMAAFAGVCTRDRRCLTAAASGLHRANVMSLDDAAEALGLSAKAVRVARNRKSPSFLIAEGRVIAAVSGAIEEGPGGECSDRAMIAAGLKKAHADPVKHEKWRAASRDNWAKASARIGARRARGEVVGRRPMAPHVARKLPYLKRFIAAGWTIAETAKLFDLGWKTVDRAVNRG